MLLALPLHRLVVPAWPDGLEERVDPVAERVSVYPASSGGTLPGGNSQLVTRPASLTLVELETGDEPQIGYLIGLRDGESGRMIEAFSGLGWTWLEGSELPETSVVVLQVPGSGMRELPAERVRRLLRPNRMGPGERALLTWKRLTDRWYERR